MINLLDDTRNQQVTGLRQMMNQKECLTIVALNLKHLL